MRREPKWSAVACAALAVAGCRTVPVAPAGASWELTRPALQSLDHFELKGRVAVAAGQEGLNARLRWVQDGNRASLALDGPLGAGVHVTAQGDRVDVVTSRGEHLDSAAGKDELVNRLGFEPPWESLRFWLLGVPNPGEPASEALDARTQRLQSLRQGDWQIDYASYVQAGAQWLPARITLHGKGVRVRLIVDAWSSV